MKNDAGPLHMTYLFVVIVDGKAQEPNLVALLGATPTGQHTVKVQPKFSPGDSTVILPPCKSKMAFETKDKHNEILTGNYHRDDHGVIEEHQMNVLNNPSPEPPPACSFSGLNWTDPRNRRLIFSCHTLCPECV